MRLATNASGDNDPGSGAADSSTADSASAGVDGPSIEWSVWPALQRPGAALLAVSAIVVFCGLVWLESAGLWWTVFSAVALLVALNRFFLPSRFVLDAEGVTAYYPLQTRRLPWRRIRRFRCDEMGGILSVNARSGWSDRRTAITLLFPSDDPAPAAAVRDAYEKGKSCAG